MPTKIYKPSDFPKPKPDQYREELFQKVQSAVESNQYVRKDTCVSVIISNSAKYTQDNFKDFSNKYAILGGWNKVEVVENVKTLELRVDLYF